MAKPTTSLPDDFCNRFVDDVPWLHVDCPPAVARVGWAAVASDVTGFGVGWGLRMLQQL